MVSLRDQKRPTLSWRTWTVLALGLAAQVAVTVLVMVIAGSPGRPQPAQNIRLMPVYVVIPPVETTQGVATPQAARP
jgi:hypothetical protein